MGRKGSEKTGFGDFNLRVRTLGTVEAVPCQGFDTPPSLFWVLGSISDRDVLSPRRASPNEGAPRLQGQRTYYVVIGGGTARPKTPETLALRRGGTGVVGGWDRRGGTAYLNRLQSLGWHRVGQG